jgi:hypothetical protein
MHYLICTEQAFDKPEPEPQDLFDERGAGTATSYGFGFDSFE